MDTASAYQPHTQQLNSGNRSNVEYGLMRAGPNLTESSFESRTPTAAILNYSNVQIVCRINAPIKCQQTNTSSKAVIKRPNSASKIHFQSAMASGPSFKGKEHTTRNQIKLINPSRSFMSCQSTPAMRSPSLEYSRSGPRKDGFVPLRSKMKPLNGVRFPSGSPTPQLSNYNDQRRQSKNNSKLLVNASQLSHQSSQKNNTSMRASGIRTPTSGNGFRQDAKFSVFTTAQEQSNKVVVSETPISAKIISEQLAEASQLDTFLGSCGTQGYDANVFDFDNVFSEGQRQDKFYKQCVKATVQAFVEGENGTVILFGPSQSGKTYTMHGKAGKERGIIPRAIEEVLSIVKNTYENNDQLNGSSLIEDFGTDTQPILSVNAAGNSKFGIPKAILQSNSQIQVYGTADSGRDYDATQDRLYIKGSVYMIYCDRVYDLLSLKSGKKVKKECYIDPQSQQVVSKFTNMTERLVLNLESYYSMVQDAFKERKVISVKLTDHEIRKRSHLVISLALITQTPEGSVREVSRLNFAELCGSEQSVANGNQARDTTVRQFVTKSFNCLSTQVLKSALGKRTQIDEGDSGLVGCLKNTLTSKSNILMIACASPVPQCFDHSLPAIKFCGRIRDTIVRKLQKQGFQSHRNQLEDSQAVTARTDVTAHQPQSVMKQTRFNLDVEKQGSSQALQTFGRVSQFSDRNNEPPSSLKKPNQRKHSRSSSPMMTLDEIDSIGKQLESDVKMYDSLTREYLNGNEQAVDLSEVREWAIRSLETLNKALYSVQKSKLANHRSDKKTRDDAINLLFYLKERITSIEQKVMTASQFRSLSPKSRDVNAAGKSMGTTSAASMRNDGRDNPFNQVVHVAGELSHCSSAVRKNASNDRYYNSVKEMTHAKEPTSEYRTFDYKTTPMEEKDKAFSKAELTKQPFHSKYGRELSERMESEQMMRRIDDNSGGKKMPQSARDYHKEVDNHSLRNFSGSPSRRNGSEGRKNDPIGAPAAGIDIRSPTFDSGQPNLHKKQQNSFTQQNQDSPDRKSATLTSAKKSHFGDSNLMSFRDQPDLQMLQDKFLSSQRVQHIVRSTFGDSQAPKALYSNAEETLTDIQRLIMLEDFDGLRRRVMQLFKERQNCDELITTKEVEIGELRHQLDARDDAITTVERLNERNLDEYLKTIGESNIGREKNETQSSLHIRNLQETIEQQTVQLEDYKHTRISEDQKLEHMSQQFEINNQLRMEAEGKAARLQQENDKLYTNYDVLKEHELNIIKDFQDKKVSNQVKWESQIEDLRLALDAKNEELLAMKNKICDIETNLRKQEFETERVHEQKTLQNDAQGILQGKLDREFSEATKLRDKISLLENEIEKERNISRQEVTEKKLAFQEIKQLQELISEMEKSMQRISEELRQAKHLTENRQSQIAELDTQKRVYEERFELKEREMQSYIQSKNEMVEQLKKLQSDFDELDHKHIKLRAQEFDKVDVLKVNAELEGRSKNLQIDVENLIKERNSLQDKNREMEEENEEVSEKARQLQSELEYYRRAHEGAMTTFETKFSEFQHELNELTESNQEYKDKEKKSKRHINQLEVKNLELEEKFKYANQRNRDLNAQVEFVEKDMQNLAKETGAQVAMQTKTVVDSQKRQDATERAFTDIKSMISNFRRERNNSKEANTQRGYSGGRRSRSREGSPTVRMQMSGISERQSSNSPEEWQRKGMSPLRNRQHQQ